MIKQRYSRNLQTVLSRLDSVDTQAILGMKANETLLHEVNRIGNKNTTKFCNVHLTLGTGFTEVHIYKFSISVPWESFKYQI